MHATLGRRTQLLFVVVLAAAGLIGVARPAWAHDGSRGHRHADTYLALGDSVPFGFAGNLPPQAYLDPRAFVGYPELVAGRLGLELLNASCPGETTDSFIDAEAQSNGCENSLDSPVAYRDLYPLHVDYEGSQLDYAIETLQHNRHVRLVTLTLGANDGFLCQRAAQSYCTSAADVAGLAAHVGANLDRILSALRTEGGYTGRIVVTTYYALNYSPDDPLLPGIEGLNAVIAAAATANGALVADGFGAFMARALRAGGSSIAAGLVLPNDIHPTRLGHYLLAEAVEKVAAD
jgi:lysophospholipase L1-like esterase